MKFRKLLVFLLFLAFGIQPSLAVVSGSYVLQPQREVPWVVSIWVNSDDSEDGEPEFICSGSLIAPQLVLTAAHCFQGIKGVFYIEFGATKLGQGQLIPIDSYWISPRYNKLSIVNDVAVAHILVPANPTVFPRLDTSLSTGKSGSPATVYGWGADQNGEVTGDLRKSSLLFSASTAAKTFGSAFNAKTNLAAGKYISKERIYTAACHGDSGGPLVTGSAAKPTLVGIVSYGPAESCNMKVPTVFSRVAYYRSDLKSAISYVNSRSQTDSIAPPMNLTAPSIIGSQSLGELLSCNIGTWTSNAKSYKIRWIQEVSKGSYKTLSTETDLRLQLKRSYFSSNIWCEVQASSNSAEEFAYAKIALPDLPASIAFSKPAEGSQVSGKFDVSLAALSGTSEKDEVVSLCVLMNSKPIDSNSDANGCSRYFDELETYSFDATQWTDGPLVFEAKGVLSSGASTPIVKLNLVLKNLPPVATFTEPDADSVISGEIKLKATAKPSSGGTATISKHCLMINGKIPDQGYYFNSWRLVSNQDSKGCISFTDQSPEWNFDVTKWTNGTYEFSYYTIDSSGRISATVKRSFTVKNDNPVATFTEPDADSVISGEIKLKATAKPSSGGTATISKHCLMINGKIPDQGYYFNSWRLVSNQDSKGCISFTDQSPEWNFDVTKWTNGTYEFSYYTIDSSGRISATVKRSFTVKNDNPVATFTEPDADSVISGEIKLKATAKPSSGGTATISKHCLMINGKIPDQGYYFNSWRLVSNQDSKGCISFTDQSPEWNFDVTKWTNGTYEFSYYTIDSSGRISATVKRSFTVKNDNPVATFTEPDADSVISGEIKLKATAKPSSGGTATISKHCLMINGKIPDQGYYFNSWRLVSNQDSKGCISFTDQSPEWNFDVTKWTNGTYEFSYYTIDSSGRISATVKRSFTKS